MEATIKITDIETGVKVELIFDPPLEDDTTEISTAMYYAQVAMQAMHDISASDEDEICH